MKERGGWRLLLLLLQLLLLLSGGPMQTLPCGCYSHLNLVTLHVTRPNQSPSAITRLV